MSAPFAPVNPALYDAIFAYYKQIVGSAENAGQDFNNASFLSTFPHGLVPEEGADDEEPGVMAQHRLALIEAGFQGPNREQVVKTIDAVYAHYNGGTEEDYFLELIADFLNYAITRCAGLPENEGLARFQRYYKRLESDVYGNKINVDSFALLNGVTHHGHFGGYLGFSLEHNLRTPASLPTAHLRDRVIPYMEIQKSAAGRLEDQGAFLVLHYEHAIERSKDALSDGHNQSAEAFKKFVLAIRLIANSPVYIDYEGFRYVGNMSVGNMGVYQSRNERFISDHTPDLAFPKRLESLLDHLMPLKFEKVAVIDWKVDDAFRRQQPLPHRTHRTKKHVELEQLIDYFQVLDGILAAQGSYQMAMRAAALLGSHLNDSGVKTKEVFEFLRDMYELRNAVVHGRIDDALAGNVRLQYGNELNIWRMQQIANELAILFIANQHHGKNLAKAADALATRQSVTLNRI